MRAISANTIIIGKKPKEEHMAQNTNKAPSSRRPAAEPAAPAAASSYTLTPGTEAALRRIAGDLRVQPDLLVEIAVAQWCRYRGAEPTAC